MAKNKCSRMGAAQLNIACLSYNYNRAKNIAVSSIGWEGLPPEIDERALEITLYQNGAAIFFRLLDDTYACLGVTPEGKLNPYGVPVIRRAYSSWTNFTKRLDETNSVIIYNNYTRTGIDGECMLFANRVTNVDRTIDVNVNTQKTPYIAKAKNQQTKLELTKILEGILTNVPVIGTTKKEKTELSDDLQIFNLNTTSGSYVGDRLNTLKRELWNDWLSYLGIPNIGYTKRAQVNSAEMEYNSGQYMAEQACRLSIRETAAKQINSMFGLNITPYYRYTRIGGELRGRMDNNSQGDLREPGW